MREERGAAFFSFTFGSTEEDVADTAAGWRGGGVWCSVGDVVLIKKGRGSEPRPAVKVLTVGAAESGARFSIRMKRMQELPHLN